MPLVRIDLSNAYSREQRLIVGDVVYSAMIDIANVPVHDKFQIITVHNDGAPFTACPMAIVLSPISSLSLWISHGPPRAGGKYHRGRKNCKVARSANRGYDRQREDGLQS